MSMLRLWFLLALIALMNCEELEESSGTGFGGIGADDEDFDGASGSGGGPPPQQTTTVRAPSPAVIQITSTSTQRTTVKSVTTTKVSTTQPAIRTSKLPIVVTTTSVDDDADLDETTKASDDYSDGGSDNDDSEIDETDNSQQPLTTTMAIDMKDKDDTTSSETATYSRNIFDSILKQPGIFAGLIGGAILGVLFAILLTLFVIYRLRRRADRKYRKAGTRGSQDDTGAFWFDDEDAGAIAVSRASAERHMAQTQSSVYSNPHVGTLKGSQMLTLPVSLNTQTSSLLYAPTAVSNAQMTYDDYVNYYNQQMYNGYLQQKA